MHARTGISGKAANPAGLSFETQNPDQRYNGTGRRRRSLSEGDTGWNREEKKYWFGTVTFC